jgi:hypothetical protein
MILPPVILPKPPPPCIANSPLVKQITFKQSSATRMTTTKSWDHVNRLTSIGSSNATPALVDWHGYAYESADQRTSHTNTRSGLWRLSRVAVVIASAGLLGCAERRSERQAYPDAFAKAARAFRLKAPADRFGEAQTLARQLPRCPVTSVLDTGIGGIVSHDYAHPTFMLSRSDVTRLLGNPLSARSEEYTYAVASGGENTFDWFLGVHFNRDYVVSSTLFSSDRGAGPGK